MHTLNIARVSYIGFLVLFLLLSARGQTVKGLNLSELRADLAAGTPWSFPDTTGREKSELREKSPALAMTLSSLLPGAGQFYNESYWKIPIIYGFGAWFAVNWKKADDLYRQYRDEYSASVGKKEFGGTGDERLRYIRDFYRNERDRFSLYLGLTYLLNIVDAYVGASLYSFDVGEDLTGSANLRLNVHIPLK
ncbi:MAG: hypothetical protein FJ215_07105 [Ignavibacteria bacterium]|nr:hypothetical protein [Ignavibacteria bacterium]